MIRRILVLVLGLLPILAAPTAVFAADDEEPNKINARLENFSKPVKLEDGSNLLIWLMLMILAGLCLAGLFKQAKRTHLD
jgi:hypothetical protein